VGFDPIIQQDSLSEKSRRERGQEIGSGILQITSSLGVSRMELAVGPGKGLQAGNQKGAYFQGFGCPKGDFFCALSILAHESRKDTVRLNTGAPSRESTESTQK